MKAGAAFVRRSASVVLPHLVLILASVIILIPIAYVVTISFKPYLAIITGSWSFDPTWRNYASLFDPSKTSFLNLTTNSLVAGFGSTVIVLTIGTLAAYGVSRLDSWRFWRGLILAWLLFVHMVPPATFIGPFYLIARRLGIYDTPFAVIMAHVVINLPLTVWMMQSFFAEVPQELEEAAAIDGCGHASTFWRIVLPVVRSGLVATAILAFVFSWKDFLFALTLTSTPAGMTVPVGISTFVQEWNIRYGEMAAATVVAMIPGLVLLSFAQKQIVKGLTLGALKG